MQEYYNWTSHGEKRVQEYFEVVTAPPLQEEQTPAAHEEQGTSTHWSNAAQTDWEQRMVFHARRIGFQVF
ncbi:UNVERIFIED_CONTAM: hypothetical protein Sradi_4406100 [Sesamum radiatum]|uniref:Uncharacterized protein n=1 Tax=Sesamum radiatum TaxID=300843 RepID=A0AAW2NQP2_SESRA